MRAKKQSNIEDFIALPDWKKEEIFQELENESPEDRLANSRPLNAKERAQWARFKKRAAKTEAMANSVEKIVIDVDQTLLKQADRYAKRHKMNRSELFSRGLQRLIEKA